MFDWRPVAPVTSFRSFIAIGKNLLFYALNYVNFTYKLYIHEIHDILTLWSFLEIKSSNVALMGKMVIL